MMEYHNYPPRPFQPFGILGNPFIGFLNRDMLNRLNDYAAEKPTMNHHSFTLNNLTENPNDFSYLQKEGKLYIFYDSSIIKQGSYKGKSMQFALLRWLEKDAQIAKIANVEPEELLILAIWTEEIDEEPEEFDNEQYDQIESLKTVLSVNNEYQDEPEDLIIGQIPLGNDYNDLRERLRIADVIIDNDELANKLTDWEMDFLSGSTSRRKNLSEGQKEVFFRIEAKFSNYNYGS